MTVPELWPHQKALVEKIRASVSRGNKRVVAVLPTGGGKTNLCAFMCASHIAKGGRVLWLAHRKELLEQAYGTLVKYGLDVGMIVSGISGMRCNPHRTTQVASIQTLLARDHFPPATMVIYDESHISMAPEFSRCITAYPDAIIIAPTATPCRGDGVGLGEHFQDMVEGASTAELVAAGVLVPCEYVAPKRSLGSKRIAQSPVKAWLEHGKGLRTLCFAPHAMAAEQYLAEFTAAGVRAAYVHHQSTDRTELLRRYSAGEIDVLINQQLLTTGYDDPATACCILARPCGHVGIYKQIIGRILRASPGKTHALLIDLTGAVHVHGKPDAEYDYSLDGDPIRKKGEPLLGRLCQVCGAPIPINVHICNDCGTATSQMAMPDITNDKLERFAWVRDNHSDTQKRERYMRWSAEAEHAGHSSGKVYYKYRAVYGSDPEWDWKFEYAKEREKWLSQITKYSASSSTKRRSKKTTSGKQSDCFSDSDLVLIPSSTNGKNNGQ